MYSFLETNMTYVAFTNVGDFFGGPLGEIFESELLVDVPK